MDNLEESYESSIFQDKHTTSNDLDSNEDNFLSILDFDYYPEEINSLLDSDFTKNDQFELNLRSLEEDIEENISLSSGPIEFNLSSLQATDDLSENELDNILSKPSRDTIFDESEEESISLSGEELNNITSDVDDSLSLLDSEDDEDDNNLLIADELNDRYDNLDDEEISFDSEDLDHTLDPDDEEDEDLESDSIFTEDESVVEKIYGSEEDYDSPVEGEEISLSTDELDNILSDGGEYLDETPIEEEEDESEHKSFFDSFEDEEGPIGLSEDELDKITNPSDTNPSIPSLFDETSEDESISLSADELGNITAEETEEVGSVFEEGEEENEIALSGDELNNLLDSGEIESEESSSLFDETSEDESISLSADELGNITAEETEEVSLDSNELNNITFEDEAEDTTEEFIFQDDEESSSNSFLENDSNEEIALSGSELDNLLESGSEGLDETPVLNNSDIQDDDFILDDTISNDSNLEETANEIDPEDLKLKHIKKDELKKLMSHMDELLGSLPDSYIKEFASSEYFDLYKKIMSELDL